MYHFKHFAILSSIFIGLHVVRGADLATASITAAPDYVVEQSCVQACLYGYVYGFVFGLPLYLGCSSTVYNACYCTSAIQGQASSYLSSCVSQSCLGTSQISEAVSVYDSYCIGAGYPRNTGNAQTPVTTTNGAQATDIPSSVYTVTLGTQTFVYTEPAGIVPVGTAAASTPFATSTSSSSSSNSPSTSGQTTSSSKTNIGAIVGGVLGGLALVAIILLLILLLLRRRSRKSKETALPPTTEAPNPQAVPAIARPTSIQKRPVGGRAELENNKTESIPTVTAEEVEANEKQMRGMESVNRFGLRPDELDVNGRYIGELHGDGRHLSDAEVELPGSDMFGAHDTHQ